MAHENLEALNAWALGTGILHVTVRWNGNQDERWAVRVCTNAWGMTHPIRTRHGNDLEAVCAELLPLAVATYEQQKNALLKRDAEHKKRHRYDHHRETAEIEAMHHTAGDF